MISVTSAQFLCLSPGAGARFLGSGWALVLLTLGCLSKADLLSPLGARLGAPVLFVLLSCSILEHREQGGIQDSRAACAPCQKLLHENI